MLIHWYWLHLLHLHVYIDGNPLLLFYAASSIIMVHDTACRCAMCMYTPSTCCTSTLQAKRALGMEIKQSSGAVKEELLQALREQDQSYSNQVSVN